MIIIVTMAQKRGPDEAFLALYYINKACVKIPKVLFEIWPFFYISLTRNIAFVFNWFFILFPSLQQCSIPHSQIYNFLIAWLGLLIFGISIHQLILIHCSWLCFTFDLDFWSQDQIANCNMKILYLAHNVFLIGCRLKFLACG